MQKELPYYTVDGDYGWDQDKFPGFLMKHAGCAAVTACDSCIYLKLYKDFPELCSCTSADIKREDYLALAGEMKHYLHPRQNGIDTLELYMECFGNYLRDRNSSLRMTPFSGNEQLSDAVKVIMEQIDREIPIPYLMLRHTKQEFYDYTWHWFMLTGYRTANSESDKGSVLLPHPSSVDRGQQSCQNFSPVPVHHNRESFQVKVVSYGEAVWFSLAELWDTGNDQKGGMILFSV